MRIASAALLLIAVCVACADLAAVPPVSVAPSSIPVATVTPTPIPTESPTPIATPSPAPSPQPTVAAATPVVSASPTATDSPSSGPEEPPFVIDPPVGSDLELVWRHIPVGLRQNCHGTASFDAGHIAGLQCTPEAIDGYIRYGLFDTLENLQAAYQSNFDFFGDEATGSTCETGPAENGYTIGGTPAGRLMCAPYDEGLIAVWTHEGLLIQSTMFLNTEDYPGFWSLWQVAGPDPAEGPSTSPPDPSAEAITWLDTAQEYRGQNGTELSFVCTPDGTLSAVYGTDTYTDDSSICGAAVHAGLITIQSGGPVTIVIRPGQDSYTGSTRNGVTSSSWGIWPGSFDFVP